MPFCTLKIYASTYAQQDDNPSIFDGISAVISTERTDFGGYSYFHSVDILTGLGQEPLPIKLNECSKFSAEQLEKQPLFILTPVVSNNANEAKNLLLEILKLSDELELKKIVFTHFIELKSNRERKYHQNFIGITEAVKSYSPKHDIELIFLLDKRYFDYYEAEFNLSGH